VEFRIVLGRGIRLFQAQQQRHQRLGDKAPAIGAEMPARIGTETKTVGRSGHSAPAFSPAFWSVYRALRAFDTKAAIFSALFFPGASSTPEDASTNSGRAILIARAMFSALSPPARPHGRLKRCPVSSCQSNAAPKPPGRVAAMSALASNRMYSATSSYA